MFALDVSRVIRPHENILYASSEERSYEILTEKVDEIQKIVLPEFREYVFGAILYAHIPAHMMQERSPILTLNEEPITWLMQYTASDLWFLENIRSPHHETVKTIFDKFSQADNTTTRKFGGTGLGLAICKKIIENHRGYILATSEIGKGSAFIIYLPAIS